MMRLTRAKHRKVQTKIKSKKKKRVSRGTETDFNQVEEQAPYEEIKLDDSFGIWMGEKTSTPEKICGSPGSPVWCTHTQVKVNDHSAHSIVLFEETILSSETRLGPTSKPVLQNRSHSPVTTCTNTKNSPMTVAGFPPQLNLSPVTLDREEDSSVLLCPSGKVYFRKENAGTPGSNTETSLSYHGIHGTPSPSKVEKTQAKAESIDFTSEHERNETGKQVGIIEGDYDEERKTSNQKKSETWVDSVPHEASVDGAFRSTGTPTCYHLHDGLLDITEGIKTRNSQNTHENCEKLQEMIPLQTYEATNDGKEICSQSQDTSARGDYHGTHLLNHVHGNSFHDWTEDKENWSPLIPRQRRSRKGIAPNVDDVIKNFNAAMNDVNDIFQDMTGCDLSASNSIKENVVHGSSRLPLGSKHLADNTKGSRTLRDVTNNHVFVHGQYKAPRDVQFRSPSSVKSRTLPTGRNNLPDKHIYCNLPWMMFPCLSEQESIHDKDDSNAKSSTFNAESLNCISGIEKVSFCKDSNDGKNVLCETNTNGPRLGERHFETLDDQTVARTERNSEQTSTKEVNTKLQSHPDEPISCKFSSKLYLRDRTSESVCIETDEHTKSKRKAPATGFPPLRRQEVSCLSPKLQAERNTVSTYENERPQLPLSLDAQPDRLATDRKFVVSQITSCHLDCKTDPNKNRNVSEVSSRATYRDQVKVKMTSTFCGSHRSGDSLAKTCPASGKRVPKLLEFFESHPSLHGSDKTAPEKKSSSSVKITSSVSDRISELERRQSIASNDENSRPTELRRSFGGRPVREAKDHWPTNEKDSVRRGLTRKSLPATIPSLPSNEVLGPSEDDDRGVRSSRGQRHNLYSYEKKNYQAESRRTSRKQKRHTKEAILMCDYKSRETGKKEGISFQRGEVVQILSNWFDGQVRVRKNPDKTEAILPRKCLFFISGGVSIAGRDEFGQNEKHSSINEDKPADDKSHRNNSGYFLEPYLVVQPHIAGSEDEVTVLRGEVIVVHADTIKQKEGEPHNWVRVYVPRTQQFGSVPLSKTQPLIFGPTQESLSP